MVRSVRKIGKAARRKRMKEFVLFLDDRPAPWYPGMNKKFSHIIGHAGSDYRMRKFKKRKYKMRKAK